MFTRKIYEYLLEWKRRDSGRTAALIEGPRRVGKSTVAKAFAQNEYRTHILVDFSAASQSVGELFEDVSDLDYLFLQLQLHYGVQLHKRESAIIFDEVQLCERALTSLKYFCEDAPDYHIIVAGSLLGVADGRYDYIETGSLISIRRNVQGIVIPSEEYKLQMRPMDFEEFKWALGDTGTIPLLKKTFEERRPLGDQLNRKLMRDFRLYMLVGGMPQAVSSYIETNNLQAVDTVKRGIISLYEDDFHKISPSGALSLLFDAIPAQLSKKASRYQVSAVLANRQASDVLEEISELKESKTTLVAYHANDPNVGMSSSIDLEKFKLYLADTGLFVTLMFKDRDFTDNTVYQALLSDKLPANLGSVYENVVAQELVAQGHKLFYHTWPKKGANRNYEIDFVVSDGKKISPVEVKSSGYKTHASLDAFGEKYASRIGRRFLAYTKDLRQDGDVTCMPTYMARFL